ncbi:MAG TPA: methylmalonyl-CoA epimerase [Longimicrobiales bacterium]|nr:methylmalonyl-CoA epimerase [Longimicrobiales bacterium]
MERVLDHVAIAVPSIDDALPHYETLIGARGSLPETVEAQGVRVVFIGGGAGTVELLEPLGSESPVARFLARRGPGLHHIAYRVSDIEAALAEQIAAGVQPIDSAPRPGAHGRRVAFLHPRSFSGVLVELVEAPPAR